MSTVDRNFTTISGEYYQGMTRDEAKELGIYRKTVGLDFEDINENGDNYLSRKEIIKAHNKECIRSVFTGATEVVSGIALTAIGAFLEIPSFFTSTPVLIAGSTMTTDGASRIIDAFAPTGKKGLRSYTKEKITNIFQNG